jgi:hypothetical protein
MLSSIFISYVSLTTEQHLHSLIISYQYVYTLYTYLIEM